MFTSNFDYFNVPIFLNQLGQSSGCTLFHIHFSRWVNSKEKKIQKTKITIFSGNVNILGSKYGAKGSDQSLAPQKYWNFTNFCPWNSAMPNYPLFYRSRTYIWGRFAHFCYYDVFPNYSFISQNMTHAVFTSYHDTMQPLLENAAGNIR